MNNSNEELRPEAPSAEGRSNTSGERGKSDKRPIVGIPTQTLQTLGGISADIPPSWVMSQRYVQTLTNAGAIPWLIPLVDDATLRGDDARIQLIPLRRGGEEVRGPLAVRGIYLA